MLMQSMLVLISSLVYFIITKDLNLLLYYLYGALMSIVNTLLIRHITIKQKSIKIDNENVNFKGMVINVITRLLIIEILIVIGLMLNFKPLPMFLGLVFGQIGLIIDTLRNKSINRVNKR